MKIFNKSLLVRTVTTIVLGTATLPAMAESTTYVLKGEASSD